MTSPASSGFTVFGVLRNPSRQFLPLRSRQRLFTKPKNGKSHSRNIFPRASADFLAVRKLMCFPVYCIPLTSHYPLERATLSPSAPSPHHLPCSRREGEGSAPLLFRTIHDPS